MALTVESLTHLGVGRADDGTLIPRTLPGEVVAVADGTLRVLTPSVHRVAAPCRHYKSCGGCALQHVSDAFVSDWKVSVVQRSLTAHGLTPPMRPIAVSPPSTRRRAKLSGRRTKKGTLVGFHGRASGTITEIPDCLLLSPALLASLPALHAITALAASRKGEVALTVTESAAGTDVLIQTDMALTDALRVTLPGVGRAHGLARITWNDETVATLEPPYQTLGLARVVPPPGAFLQATLAGEAALLAAVEDATQGARRIVDLFSGCGTFSLPLSKRAEVHAVEGDAAMITALDRGWRTATGLKRVTSQARDLFRRPLEPDELRGFDAAVIDPPRAGAEAQTATLARSGVRQIAMVSCNPVTFARDAATLVAGGYRLDWVQVVDQFRWSAHIEAVAAFTMA